MQSQPYLNTEYLGFLMDENNLSVTQQKAVRKAINYGFDRIKMMTYLRNNIGTPALEGFVPKGLPSFTEELNGYDYKPEKVQSITGRSRYSNRNRGGVKHYFLLFRYLRVHSKSVEGARFKHQGRGEPTLYAQRWWLLLSLTFLEVHG